MSELRSNEEMAADRSALDGPDDEAAHVAAWRLASDVPALLAEVTRLRTENERLSDDRWGQAQAARADAARAEVSQLRAKIEAVGKVADEWFGLMRLGDVPMGLLAIRRLLAEPSGTPADMCHNGHPFTPGIDTDMITEGREPDPRWCNACGSARPLGPTEDMPTEGRSE